MKIKTETLQRAVAKAVKGASLNKLLPMTNMISISTKDGTLELVTTDMTNYLYIRELIDTEDEFEVVVGIEKFSKLISRLNCDYVSLELGEKELKVLTRSGDYSIELPLDENANPVRFKDKRAQFKDKGVKSTKDIPVSVVKDILRTCKPALAVTLEAPCYTNYYTGDGILATDSYKIASLDAQFTEEPALISSETMSLLDIMDGDVIEYMTNGDEMLFESPNCTVYGIKASGLEDYAVQAIGDFVNSEFDYACKVGKEELLSALDRVSLFVGVYDNKVVKVSFKDGKLYIKNKASSAEEVIDLIESDADFEFLIDAEMLISQVKANLEDVINIQYGKKSSIKLVHGNVTQVIALSK